MADLTAERLRELVSYEPNTGRFTRKIALGRREKVGDQAGSLQLSTGYRRACLDGRVYREHRLVWLYVNGVWPAAHIDHINGVRDDNRIENLRDVCRQANNQNRRNASRNNKSSGVLGVTAKRDKWVASIRVDRRLRQIGTFTSVEAAARAYQAAKRALHVGVSQG